MARPTKVVNRRNRRIYGDYWFGRRGVRKVFFARLIQQNGKKCNICSIYFENPAKLTLDHIIPISKGGSVRDFNNMQLLCRECHFLKDHLRK